MDYVGRWISLVVSFLQHEFTLLGFVMSWWQILVAVTVMGLILYVVFGVMEG